MSDHYDSTDRTVIDYILFGSGFAGFIITVAGIILTTPGLAFVGGLLLFLVTLYFAVSSLSDR